MVSPVWTYIPNLIGYARIISAIVAFYYAFDNFQIFFIAYATSAVLDMADGHAARKFNQCTKFGAVLDMITDRASTTCLQAVLVLFYPKYALWFAFLMALDIVSHYTHMNSSLLSGSTSHKTISKDKSLILRLYYGNRYFLAFLCGGNEAFFLWLYLYHFWTGPVVSIPVLAFLDPLIGAPGGQIELVKLGIWLIAFPIMFVKQSINFVQFWQAAVDIVALDDLERMSKIKQK